MKPKDFLRSAILIIALSASGISSGVASDKNEAKHSSKITKATLFRFRENRSPEEAPRIATALVAEQFVACINIVDNIYSIYRWQGAIGSAADVAIPIRLGVQPHLDWLLVSTGDYQKSS